MKAVLASGNAGKVREFAALLAARDIEVIPQSAFGILTPEETGSTFLENALLKARHAADRRDCRRWPMTRASKWTRCGGGPGCAPHAMPASTRATPTIWRCCCVSWRACRSRGAPRAITVRWCSCAHPDDPQPIVATGVWEGRVLSAPRGTGGFGYDPVFQPEGLTLCAGELPAAQKNALSHRAQALRALLAALP